MASVTELVKDYRGKPALAAGEAFDRARKTSMRAPSRRNCLNGMKLALLPKKNRGEPVAISFNLHFGDEKSLFGNRQRQRFHRQYADARQQEIYARAIADRAGSAAYQAGVSGEGQVVTVGVETVRKNLPQVLTLMREILRQPVFPQQEFEQLRKQVLADLEASRTSRMPWRSAHWLAISTSIRKAISAIPARWTRRCCRSQRADAGAAETFLHRLFMAPIMHRWLWSAILTAPRGRSAGAKPVRRLEQQSRYTRVPTPFETPPQPPVWKLETPDKANASFLLAWRCRCAIARRIIRR